ncbi:MAG: hypothetical protein HRU18_02875 [Pseudoalteromonas sp.]|uniref:hypothetical protein n=1 Tax=Pseudoalteromonas sp. TaxID=53249 RepID=UPI001D388472|nr:hypothetical protein [Pseudoalteromonas sp.]NRA77128.1 hypothetical protein [Pseudoalteromonas sp.]
MLLKELIRQLVFGELSTLALVEDNDLGELQGGYEAIMPHINLALSSVHKRLHLREESVTLRQSASINKYFLSTKYAVSNTGSAASKYLIDSAGDPFLGNSLKIIGIELDGVKIPLNDRSIDNPILLPTPNSIRIVKPVEGQEVVVTFRADHPNVDVLTFDPDTEELDIPDFVLEPMLYFIASRVHASYPSISEGMDDSYKYRQKYEAAMKEISDHGLVDTSSNSNNKLEINGWA